ncbi:MAG: crotonase [Firmicutes bacterium]|nr:crotonase [Bacillota bacterium]
MPVRVETNAGVAVVTIDREKQLNALNVRTLQELELELTALKTDDNVKAVVLTGAGSKAFVAGADIAEMKDMTEREAFEFSGLGHRVFALVESLPKPVIAAVNGYALGGGCELALAADLRFASEKAKFGQPELGLGIIPGFGGTRRLARLVGRGRALELIYGCDTLDAARALELGLVERVFASEDLLPETLAFANKLATKSLRALRAAKAAVTAGDDPGLAREQELFAQLFTGVDQKEGMTAFIERRKPEFKE